MTDMNTLLQAAARCRRMAARCASEAIAKKFEALARDYEEHARQVGKSRMIIDIGRGKDAKAKTETDAPDLIEPSTAVA